MYGPQLKTVEDVLEQERAKVSGLTSDSKEQFLSGSNYHFTDDELKGLATTPALELIEAPEPGDEGE